MCYYFLICAERLVLINQLGPPTGWWLASVDGRQGLVPGGYLRLVDLISPPPPADSPLAARIQLWRLNRSNQKKQARLDAELARLERLKNPAPLTKPQLASSLAASLSGLLGREKAPLYDFFIR